MPAVAISASANAEQALMAGYQAFVPKPLDPAAVVGILEEFVRADRDEPSEEPTWTLSSRSPGVIMMTFAGYVGAGDVRAAMVPLLRHLEERPCEIIVDLLQLTGFSTAGGSVAARAVWRKRGAIQHVRFVGGPLAASIVASAISHLLGIGCTVER